ncbi:MAG TPA: hypothetical protein VKG43_01610 [Acidimicrobiales bacterium]|nr:hypothetical protein [Acidimicrobiales bacterium]
MRLEEHYPHRNELNGHLDVQRFLATRGFWTSNGSVYWGDPEKVDAVACVLAIQDLTHQFGWFAHCVGDVRMLRVTDSFDLQPAVLSAAATSAPSNGLRTP